MQNRNGKSRGWPYVLTGVLFAGICAWISYNDGLFVARLAGNHDALAFFYPLLPDGLIVLCLLALAEAARARSARSRWAVAGLLLGIALTLTMNTYAGVEHSALDAVLDGMVPVVFFIAAEVVLWHVRHRRNNHGITEGRSATPSTVPAPVFTDAQTAALAMLERTTAAGNPLSQNQLMTQFRLSRAEARDVRQKVALREENGNGQGQQDDHPDRHRQGRQARQDPRRGQQPEGQVAAAGPPAGEPPRLPPAPAGAELHLNGSGAHG